MQIKNPVAPVEACKPDPSTVCIIPGYLQYADKCELTMVSQSLKVKNMSIHTSNQVIGCYVQYRTSRQGCLCRCVRCHGNAQDNCPKYKHE